MGKLTESSCCGCLFGFLVLVIIILVVVGCILSKYFTIEQVGFADKEGILSNFDEEKYDATATFRTEGMEDWKVWDVLMWIIKSGNYQPAEK